MEVFRVSIPFPPRPLKSPLCSSPTHCPSHTYLIPDTHSQTEEHTSSEAETFRPQKVVGRHYVPMWRVNLIRNCSSMMCVVMTRSDYSSHLPKVQLRARSYGSSSVVTDNSPGGVESTRKHPGSVVVKAVHNFFCKGGQPGGKLPNILQWQSRSTCSRGGSRNVEGGCRYCAGP